MRGLAQDPCLYSEVAVKEVDKEVVWRQPPGKQVTSPSKEVTCLLCSELESLSDLDKFWPSLVDT